MFIDPDVFVDLLDQMLEYFTISQLAEELNVPRLRVKEWLASERLPAEEEMLRLYRLMMSHKVWDD